MGHFGSSSNEWGIAQNNHIPHIAKRLDQGQAVYVTDIRFPGEPFLLAGGYAVGPFTHSSEGTSYLLHGFDETTKRPSKWRIDHRDGEYVVMVWGPYDGGWILARGGNVRFWLPSSLLRQVP